MTTVASPAGPRMAARLRGFGPAGLFAILLVFSGSVVGPPLTALYVLIWRWLSETPWSAIGYVRPKSWAGTVAVGVAFGVVFKLVMKTVVMPLLGAPEQNAAYHYLVGNGAALPGMLVLLVVGAGFGEETFFRGYLFERLGRLLGDGLAAKVAIVGATTAFFAVVHYQGQGLPGVEQAAFTGLAFGSIFAVTGRLPMLMIAHASFDVTAVLLIYFNLESSAAHVLFH